MARSPLNLAHEDVSSPPAFSNATAVSNGKGGVGKTSVTANLSGLLADAGFRVLLIDFDPQGNANRDLGYDRDSGEALFDALRTGAVLPVTREVRPNLDVVKGGPEMFGLQAVLQGRGLSVAAALFASLEPIAGEYDHIFFDTSPGEQELVKGVLMVCRFVVIPTTPDDAGIDGVVMAAQRFALARRDNKDLRLAGVVLFNVGSKSRRIERLIRKDLEDLLDDVAPVFKRRIRHLEGAALDARRKGVLIHELEPLAAQAHRERFAALRAGSFKETPSSVHSSNVSGLAEDYAALAEEILNRLLQLKAGDQA